MVSREEASSPTQAKTKEKRKGTEEIRKQMSGSNHEWVSPRVADSRGQDR